MLKSILILEINQTRQLKNVEVLSGPNFANYLHFGELTFGEKSMESYRSIKFTHNVDQDMIKIIGE